MPRLFYQPLPFYGKNFENSKNSTLLPLPFYKGKGGAGGDFNYDIVSKSSILYAIRFLDSSLDQVPLKKA